MKQSKRTLLLGYSFTLRDDGAPGNCNVAIAKRMWRDMVTDDPGSRPYVAVQWEIYDALEDLGHPVSDYIPDDFVITPPHFTEGDILSRGRLFEWVANPRTPAEQSLLHEMQSTTSWSVLHPQMLQRDRFKISKIHLANFLNELLADGQERLYRKFIGLLDIQDLYRVEKGPVGLEKRRLPDDGPRKGSALRRFQAKRVNRFIVEAAIPPVVACRLEGTEAKAGILKRGEYLNVEQVATTCLHHIRRRGYDIDRIYVYGHPEHRDWCRMNTSMQAAEILGLHERHVYLGDDSSWSDDELWDRLSAQVWCRSKGNWRYYIAL